MSSCLGRPLAAGFLFFFATLAHPQTPDSLIGAADLTKIKQIGSPEISPDGKSVVYTLKTIEEKTDKPGEYVYRTQLWWVSMDGHSGSRQLTHGEASAASPVWSPQGDRVAFVRTEKDIPQIWILPVGPGGGEAFAVTKFPQGAENPRWSREGDLLLFTARLSLAEVRQELEKLAPGQPATWNDERVGRTFADTANWAVRSSKPADPKSKAPPGPVTNPDGTSQEQREWLAKNEAENNPRVMTRLDFVGESELEPTEEFSHLYLVKAKEAAPPKLLTPGFVTIDDAVWISTPTGPQIVVSGLNGPQNKHSDRIPERDLWVIDPRGKSPTPLLHDEHFAYSEPVASPDGQSVAFLADDRGRNNYAQTTVGVVTVADGAKKILTAKLDRTAARPKWSGDGKFVYFVAANNGGYPLYRVAVATGKVENLTTPADGIREYDTSADDVVIVLNKADNPSELYRVNPLGKDFRLLTAQNSEWLREKTLSLPEHRELTRPDGLKIDVWLMRPAFFESGRKYPLLVEIHGGPQAMWGPSSPTVWHELQFFASRGYGVVYCNPRGSLGYGYAFQHANYQDWGVGPSGDVLAAVDLAAKEPWVDSDREVITGGSYGGYLTVWIISHDHRFKAAISQRGVYDLSVFFGEGNAWRLVPYQFGGFPWQPEIRKLLDEQSPLFHVADITTPLLIKHGDIDLRTGIAQSELLYKSLKVLGKPAEYVRYPHGTHELSRTGDPKQRIDRLVRFDEFFQRFISKKDK